eukprot:UN12103
MPNTIVVFFFWCKFMKSSRKTFAKICVFSQPLLCYI